MVEDSLWKIFGMILSVILIFVVPSMYSYQRQDDIAYNVIMVEANAFSQKIRESGKINQQMIDEFNSTLATSGLTYDIEFEHQQKRFSDKEGSIEVFYEGVYTESICWHVQKEDTYYLKTGDFFYIRVRNTSESKSQSFKRILGLSRKKYLDIYVVSGGIVRYGNS